MGILLVGCMAGRSCANLFSSNTVGILLVGCMAGRGCADISPRLFFLGITQGLGGVKNRAGPKFCKLFLSEILEGKGIAFLTIHHIKASYAVCTSNGDSVAARNIRNRN